LKGEKIEDKDVESVRKDVWGLCATQNAVCAAQWSD